MVQRPERFVGVAPADAFRILGLITWIILTLFLLRGARIALGDVAYPTAWTPISTAVSHLFTWMSEDWQSFFAWFFLWAHLALVLGFLVYLPYSKHLHIITSAINVWFASTRPRGALEPLRIDMEQLESGEQSLGAADALSDLTRKELLDLYACTECGRCQSVCPAWNTGKPLSPKLLIMNLRDHLLEEGPGRPAGAGRGRDARPGGAGAGRRRRRRRVVVHDVRRVRAGVPRGHRARRHDRRPPPGAGDG